MDSSFTAAGAAGRPQASADASTLLSTTAWPGLVHRRSSMQSGASQLLGPYQQAAAASAHARRKSLEAGGLAAAFTMRPLTGFSPTAAGSSSLATPPWSPASLQEAAEAENAPLPMSRIGFHVNYPHGAATGVAGNSLSGNGAMPGSNGTLSGCNGTLSGGNGTLSGSNAMPGNNGSNSASATHARQQLFIQQQNQIQNHLLWSRQRDEQERLEQERLRVERSKRRPRSSIDAFGAPVDVDLSQASTTLVPLGEPEREHVAASSHGNAIRLQPNTEALGGLTPPLIAMMRAPVSLPALHAPEPPTTVLQETMMDSSVGLLGQELMALDDLLHSPLPLTRDAPLVVGASSDDISSRLAMDVAAANELPPPIRHRSQSIGLSKLTLNQPTLPIELPSMGMIVQQQQASLDRLVTETIGAPQPQPQLQEQQQLFQQAPSSILLGELLQNNFATSQSRSMHQRRHSVMVPPSLNYIGAPFVKTVAGGRSATFPLTHTSPPNSVLHARRASVHLGAMTMKPRLIPPVRFSLETAAANPHIDAGPMISGLGDPTFRQNRLRHVEASLDEEADPLTSSMEHLSAETVKELLTSSPDLEERLKLEQLLFSGSLIMSSPATPLTAGANAAAKQRKPRAKSRHKDDQSAAGAEDEQNMDPNVAAVDMDGEDGSYGGVYLCDFQDCDRTFERLHNLKSHQRTHNCEKPFQCMHCPMQFSRNHDLKRHERIHAGVRAFVCPHCSKSFLRMDALSRHLKVDNGNGCRTRPRRTTTTTTRKSRKPSTKSTVSGTASQFHGTSGDQDGFGAGDEDGLGGIFGECVNTSACE